MSKKLMVLLLAVAVAKAWTKTSLVLLENGAKCIDGSPAGYYFDPSTTNSSQWIFWIEGGGACMDKSDCVDRAKTNLGSSEAYAKSRIETKDFLKNDRSVNPDFADFNHIFIPYCSGDLWIGQATRPFNPFNDDGNFQGWFQGHSILEQVVDHATQGKAVDEAILTGCSAGGIGTFVNCDWMAGRFPGKKVRCRPEAGWFGLPLKSYDAFTHKKEATADELHHEGSGWTGRITPYTHETPAFRKCLSAADFRPEDSCPNVTKCCMQVPYLYPHINTPMFVSENTADSYQVFIQGQAPQTDDNAALPYIGYLREVLAGSLTALVAHGPKRGTDGLFAPACVRHCMLWTGANKAARVRGKSHAEAFGDWYFARAAPGASMFLDDARDAAQYFRCGIM